MSNFVCNLKLQNPFKLLLYYVSPPFVTHSNQNYGRILAFKLDGGVTPLPPKFIPKKVPPPPEMDLDKTLVDKGRSLFNGYCFDCHRAGSEEEYSQYPNLAKLDPATYGILKDILLKGILSQNGMASFDTYD